jgi:hypothetical protein
VKRLVLCLATMVLLTACETSTDPLGGFINGGGGAITQAQATGNWSFTLTRTTTLACSTPALASGSVIRSHLDVLSDGTLSTASSWVNPISGVVESLSGSVNLTNGATRLTFAISASAAMELFPATMTSSGTVSGTLTDPAAGLTPAFASDGCQYTASGVKT